VGLQAFDANYAVQESVAIVAGDGTTIKGYATDASHQTVYLQITAINTDSIDHVLRCDLAFSSTYQLLSSITIPAGAGTGGARSVDVLAALLGANQTVLPMQPGNNLGFSVEVAMGGSSALTVIGLKGQC